jgi:hypothetical protein
MLKLKKLDTARGKSEGSWVDMYVRRVHLSIVCYLKISLIHEEKHCYSVTFARVLTLGSINRLTRVILLYSTPLSID